MLIDYNIFAMWFKEYWIFLQDFLIWHALSNSQFEEYSYDVPTCDFVDSFIMFFRID